MCFTDAFDVGVFHLLDIFLTKRYSKGSVFFSSLKTSVTYFGKYVIHM